MGVWSNSGKSCVKKLCTSLREHAKNIIDFEKKMLPLMKEELRSYQEAKVCHICGKRILMLKINYDYHSIIKKLVNEFEGQFECLGGKQKKVQNVLGSNKNGNYINQ